MWRPAITVLLMGFLTVYSLPTEAVSIKQDVELKIAPANSQTVGLNADYDEDYDDETYESGGLNFDIYDPVDIRPIEKVTFDNGESTFDQPQYGFRSQEPTYIYSTPEHYSISYNNQSNSQEYGQTLYNMSFSPNSDRNYEDELYPERHIDANRYKTPDYYTQTSNGRTSDQTQYYESPYNYSLSQNQNSYPKSPVKSNYDEILPRPYQYNHEASSSHSSQVRDTDSRAFNQSQNYGSNESERSEYDPSFRQSKVYNNAGSRYYDHSKPTIEDDVRYRQDRNNNKLWNSHDYPRTHNQSQYYGSSEASRLEDDPSYRQDYITGRHQNNYNYTRTDNRSQYYGSSEVVRSEVDPRYRQDYITDRRQENDNYSRTDNRSQYYGSSEAVRPEEDQRRPRQNEPHGNGYEYYGSTAKESGRIQENSYNHRLSLQEGSSPTHHSNEYIYNYTQDYGKSSDRESDTRRIETRGEERVNDGFQTYDLNQRQIDEDDQEVTFDDIERTADVYGEKERSSSAKVIDSITPDPKRIDTYPYERETHRNYDNRLVYQPDSSSDNYARQSPTGRDDYRSSQDTTTNSYHSRKNQVDEYWREEEQRKKEYESQNTYRRDSGNERLDNKDGCTFDSLGRPIYCPAVSPSSSSNNEDPIYMRAPSQPIPNGYPPLEINKTTSNPAGEKESAEVEAQRTAFERANRVQLSVPHWPTRDIDRLGFYPRHPACKLPPKWGVGPEERSAWFYSPTDGRCLWFSYAGHGGNANRFYSRANCESLCVFEQSDLCQNAQCGYPGSRCMLRGDERCKEYAKSRGKDLETECPPDQPVCRARRAIIPPEYDTSMIPRECKEKVDSGGCLVRNPLIRYYYDERSNTCRAFYFHGCGGNNNRFENMQECMNHCAL